MSVGIRELKQPPAFHSSGEIMQIRVTCPDVRRYFGCAAVNVVTLAPMVNGHHSFSRYFKGFFLHNFLELKVAEALLSSMPHASEILC